MTEGTDPLARQAEELRGAIETINNLVGKGVSMIEAHRRLTQLQTQAQYRELTHHSRQIYGLLRGDEVLGDDLAIELARTIDAALVHIHSNHSALREELEQLESSSEKANVEFDARLLQLQKDVKHLSERQDRLGEKHVFLIEGFKELHSAVKGISDICKLQEQTLTLVNGSNANLVDRVEALERAQADG